MNSKSIVDMNIADRARLKLAALKDFLKDIEPQNCIDLKLEDIKYGVVDKFLFSKMKPDKNGFYNGVKVIHTKFSSLKDFAEYAKSNIDIIKNNTAIAFKPFNDKYHFQLIKIFNINKPSDLDKYLILM